MLHPNNSLLKAGRPLSLSFTRRQMIAMLVMLERMLIEILFMAKCGCTKAAAQAQVNRYVLVMVLPADMLLCRAQILG
jgi:hypothetical protein